MVETNASAQGAGLTRRIGASAVRRWPWGAAILAAALAVLLFFAMRDRGPASPAEMLEDVRHATREREIARAVSALKDIESATVLLSRSAEGERKRASVTLVMREGTVLGPETAAGVAGLVASAAPGLDPADVIVVDSRDPARTHRLAPDADVAHEGAALLRLRSQVERRLTDKIRSFFAGMQIESVVVVSAELDLDRVKERILEVDPQGRGEVVVREERSTGLRQGEPATVAPLPGTTSANRAAELPSGSPSGGESRKTESIVSYITREIARSPKGLVDVTASVVVFDRLTQTRDGQWEYDTSVKGHLEQYRTLVAHALGVTDARAIDEKIEIKYLPSPWAQPPVAMAAGAPRSHVYATAAALVLASALVVAAVLRARRRRAAPPPIPAGTPSAGPQARQPLSPIETLRQEAARLVEDDTERAAAVLGRWVTRES